MTLEKSNELNIRELTKQQFSNFRKVRTKKSYLFGENSLYVRNHHKYIGKQLPSQQRFNSCRPSSHPIFFCLTNRRTRIYLFPLLGQPLNGLSLTRQGDSEISRWVNKCGSVQLALWQLVRFMLKAAQDLDIKDIIPECLRVQNCNLYYCYDSWMTDTRDLVKNHPQELENYYFSQQDLNEIRQYRGCYSDKKNSVLFRILLYVLNIGTFQLKLRNYQFGFYSIKWANLSQRLANFKFAYNLTGLSHFVQSVIQGSNVTMEEIWGIMSPIKKKGHSSNKKQQIKGNTSKKQNQQGTLVNATEEEITSFCYDSSCSQMTNSFNILGQVQNSDSHKMIKLRNYKNNKIKKSVPQSTNNLLNIKKKLIQNVTEVSMRLVSYLELEQYIPTTTYQKHIIAAIQNIYIRQNWERKIYPNGSVYFGEILKDQRHGHGLYLFQSDDFFYGNWVQNNIHGYGVYVFKSGQSYEGDLQDGAKHGHGSYIYVDGRKYEGSWVMNIKKVQVVFIGVFGDASYTQGLFINNQTGEQWSGSLESYAYINKTIVKIQEKQLSHRQRFKKCKIDNYERKCSKEGITYEGQYREGNKSVFGILKMGNQRYEGYWRDGQFDGDGILHIQIDNGFSIDGKWKNGMLYEYKYQDQVQNPFTIQ